MLERLAPSRHAEIVARSIVPIVLIVTTALAAPAVAQQEHPAPPSEPTDVNAPERAAADPLAATPDPDSPEAAPSDPSRLGPSDATEVEAFVDGLMAVSLEAYHQAGATVSVVRGGEILLAKGYGYADVDERRKVDADRTLFRIESVSKLFVWTAVMQLFEQGQLDLDADVNIYLKGLRIPAT